MRRRKVTRNNALRIAWMTDSHAWSVVDNQPEHPNATLGSRYFFTVGDKIEQFVSQVNADAPHFVMHTGDMVESGREFEFFLTKWGALSPGLPQAVVPGNHDFAFSPPGGTTRHDTIAGDMGYAGNPLVAGSKFNKAYDLAGNGVTARLLMLDTNISQTTGLHVAGNVGFMSDAMLTWIAGQLAASPANLILLASHHGPHMWTGTPGYFDPTDAIALRDIVDAEVAARPARKIMYLFGHHHIQSAVMRWSTLGTNLPGLLAPATVELNPASYINLLINAKGEVGWEMRSTQYPNP